MLIVAWETTAACNLSCSYCRAAASPVPDVDELSTSEALAFIDELAHLQPPSPMLILSGGEPLLRPDIFLLARHAVDLGLRASLATNGTLLTSDIVEKIRESGIGRVSISLDGASSEMHDAARGPGSFLRAMKGLESLRGRVDFQINFTITKRNEHDLLKVFDLAHGLEASALHIFFLVPTGRGRKEDLISPERQDELLRLIEMERSKSCLEVHVTCAPQFARIAKDRSRGRGGGCLAGKNFVFVSRRGDVYPCGYFPLKAGSIREKEFIEIWEKSPLFMTLRERDLKGKCGSCDYRMVCGGCRARAFAETGDCMESDPLCSFGA